MMRRASRIPAGLLGGVYMTPLANDVVAYHATGPAQLTRTSAGRLPEGSSRRNRLDAGRRVPAMVDA
jgi:hypothetical protein